MCIHIYVCVHGNFISFLISSCVYMCICSRFKNIIVYKVYFYFSSIFYWTLIFFPYRVKTRLIYSEQRLPICLISQKKMWIFLLLLIRPTILPFRLLMSVTRRMAHHTIKLKDWMGSLVRVKLGWVKEKRE